MPDYMKTLITNGKGKIEITKCPLPRIGECEALVKMISCGICNGTDGKLIHGTFKGFSKSDYPTMLGHEGVGRVVEIGSKVVSYKIGDIVLLPFAGPIGEFTSGWGAFSEYGTVTDAKSLQNDGILPHSPNFPESACAQTILPTWVDPIKAAMIVTLREVLSAIKYFGITPKDTVVVFGCGPVGLTFIKFMSLLGIKTIIALDLIEEKLETAKHEGAHYVLNSNDIDLVSKIKQICSDGVDFVLDAVGVSAIINQAMYLIKDRGKICCYGISPNMQTKIDWSPAPYNWQLLFQQFPSKYEEGQANEQVLDWLKHGKISLDDFVSDVVDFENILEAFEKLEKKQISKNVL